MADYSVTRLGNFEKCRYKYKLQYIDHVTVDRTKSIETFMGAMVHEALQKLYEDRKNCKIDTLEEILEYFESIWKKMYSDSVTIAKKEYTAENYLEQGRQFLRDYYGSHYPFDDMTIIGLETHDILTLPNGRTIDVRIDKLACRGTEYYVCDYKTDSRMKTQEEADRDRQLAIYSVWVRQNFRDATAVHLLWHMLRFGKDVVSERTEEQLNQLVDDIVKEIEEIETCTEWPTNPTGLCDYCEYQRVCPERRHLFFVEETAPEKLSEDEAYNAVNECAELSIKMDALKAESGELEARKRDLEGRIIAYARDNGLNAVYGSDMKYKVKREDAVSVPESRKEELKNAIIENGRFEYLQFSGSRTYSDVRKGTIPECLADFFDVKEAYTAKMSKSDRKKHEEEE